MNIFLSLFTAVLAFLFCNKEVMQIAKSDTHVIVSSYTNLKYELKVLLPEDYDPTRAYPIIYLTDAFLHYKTVAKCINKLGDEIDDIILVGISYKDYPFSIKNVLTIGELRAIDFTYPPDQSQSGVGINNGGGGLLFYQFLKEELIPMIEQKYSADTLNRTILGHSLGGYFSLFQMFNFVEEPLFTNIIALSPSIFWADLNIIRLENTINANAIELPFRLYLGIGEQEGVSNNVLFNEFIENLKKHNYQDLKYKAERYSGGHVHSTQNGFNNALKYLFKCVK